MVLRGRTDLEGLVEFSSPFDEATMIVQVNGYGRKKLGWRSGEEELTVQLEPQCVIAGRVADAQGRPVGECIVDLSCSSGDSFFYEVSAQDDGCFRFDCLPAGDYMLRIEHDRQQLYEDRLSLLPGQTYDFTSNRVASPASIEGKPVP